MKTPHLMLLILVLQSCEKRSSKVSLIDPNFGEKQGTWYVVNELSEDKILQVEGFRVFVAPSPGNKIKIEMQGKVPLSWPAVQTGSDYTFEAKKDWFVSVNSNSKTNTLFYAASLKEGWLNSVEFNRKLVGNPTTVDFKTAIEVRDVVSKMTTTESQK